MRNLTPDIHTEDQALTLVPAVGEILSDTTNRSLRVGDDVTPGGVLLAKDEDSGYASLKYNGTASTIAITSGQWAKVTIFDESNNSDGFTVTDNLIRSLSTCKAQVSLSASYASGEEVKHRWALLKNGTDLMGAASVLGQTGNNSSNVVAAVVDIVDLALGDEIGLYVQGVGTSANVDVENVVFTVTKLAGGG